MDLKDFVTSTITQIVEGIIEAQKELTPKKAYVNPPGNEFYGAPIKKPYLGVNNSFSNDIEFDVAITILEGKQTKGGIGVFAGAVALGTQGKSDTTNTSISRIKFTIPVAFPSANCGE